MPPSRSPSLAPSPPPQSGPGSDEQIKADFERDLEKSWERIGSLVQKQPHLKALMELLTRFHEAGTEAELADGECDALREEFGTKSPQYKAKRAEYKEINERLAQLSQRVEEWKKDVITDRVVELWDEADDLHGNLCVTVEKLYEAEHHELEKELDARLEEVDARVDEIKKQEIRIDQSGPPAPHKRKRNPYVSHDAEAIRQAKRRGTLLKPDKRLSLEHALSKARRGLGYRQALRYFGVAY